MRSMFFVVASLALLAVCTCLPLEPDVIQQIPPKVEPTPSVTGKNGSASSVAGGNVGASKSESVRVQRSVNQENDLLPSNNNADVPALGKTELDGRDDDDRIKVLPAYLG